MFTGCSSLAVALALLPQGHLVAFDKAHTFSLGAAVATAGAVLCRLVCSQAIRHLLSR